MWMARLEVHSANAKLNRGRALHFLLRKFKLLLKLPGRARRRRLNSYKRAAAKRVLVIESIKNLKIHPDGMKSSTQSYPGGAAAASRPLIKSMKKVGSQATVSRDAISLMLCVSLARRFPVSSLRTRAQVKASSNSSQNPRSSSFSTSATTRSTQTPKCTSTSLYLRPSRMSSSSPTTSRCRQSRRSSRSGKC